MTAKAINDPSSLGWVLDPDTGRWTWPSEGFDSAKLEEDVATNTSAISANTGAIAAKLDADKIWTGTEAEYNGLTPEADTLYFITA
jgi:hypothetical protein